MVSNKRFSPATALGLVFVMGTLLVMLGCSSPSANPAPEATAPANPTSESPEDASPTPNLAPEGHKDASYEIEGTSIKLADGFSEVEQVPGSASKLITRYFGNEATGDLSGDGTPDVAFVLAQNPGGSGTFYYVVVAVLTSSGYQGTNAMFLGDRITPQTTEIRNGRLIVNYADRKPDESMVAPPTVSVSKQFEIANGKLVEVSP